MASALHLMKKMDLNTGVHGVAGLVLDTGIEFGAGYGLGQLYHRGGEWGKRAPRIAAIGGKLAAVGVHLMTGTGANLAAGALNAVGSAGVVAVGLEMGLRHARAKTGKQAVLLPSGAALPAGATPITTMGALGQAAPGRGLSWEQIEELASMR